MKTKIKKFIKSESGFTLIELLVVIGIIAILATIGAVNFSGARAKARDGKKVADLSQIRASVEGTAAGAVDGLYQATVPADLATLTVSRTTDAYCYYVNVARTQYLAVAEDMEDATLGDTGQNANIDATGWTALRVGNTAVGECAAGAGAVPNCAANTTLCYTGTTAL